MADPVELMLSDLISRYEQRPASEAFARLYREDPRFGHVFASFHEQLNEHFHAINGRARSTRHYWADPSREMLALIEELAESLGTLGEAGFEVLFAPEYQAAVDRCEPWLSTGGSSTVPENFEPIRLIKYQPVFTRPDTNVTLDKRRLSVPLTLVGEGSYAIVYSFTDPDYGIKFAVKRAKKNLDERDLHRFKQEFDVLKRLSFPYIVEVYQYDESRNEYNMEYCDETLRHYIAGRNAKLPFASRERIALQFLYGINYIHYRSLLHRDISLENVLLKVFEGGAVLVKLSDFGLVKDRASELTRTSTDMRGTIRDPLLSSFKDYGVTNEIYAVGWVLSYIFTGKEALTAGSDAVSQIVQKCTFHDTAARYQHVIDVIGDVERLEATPTEASA